jgi:two-component system, cell cycle sensor histidine kinase and response regulator CckA
MNGPNNKQGCSQPDDEGSGGTVGKGADESWRTSSERLRTIVDMIPIPMTINRIEDGRILHANWRAEATFGLPPGGAVGRRSVEFYFNPADRDFVVAEIKKSGRLQDFEVRLRKADGTPIWIVASMEATTFNGEAALLVGYYDITDRKTAEEALRESEKLFRALAETAPVGITIVQDGVLRYVNPTVTRLMGYSAEEMIGRPPWDFVDPQMRDEIQQRSLRRQDGSEESNRFEMRILGIDGRELWVDQSVAIIEYDGKYATMGAALDITHRKQMEAQLHETQERYQTLVENIDIGIVLIDKNHDIIMCNAAEGRLFRKPASEMVGKKCYREFEKHEAICSHCPGTVAMETGQPAERDTEGVREDGTRFAARIRAFPLKGLDGSSTGFIEVVEDITERKRAEQAIVESEAKYRTLVEQIPAIVYTSPPDEASATSYVNPCVEKILGYSPLEYLREDIWRARLHPDDRDRVLTELSESMNKSGLFASEYRMIARDGRIVWFRDEAAIVRDKRGGPLFLQGVMFDITNRRLAEDELRVGRQKLADIIKGTRVGTWEWNVQTGETVFSDRWAEIVGFTLEELQPTTFQTWVDLVHPDDLARSNAMLQAHFAGELEYYAIECRLRHKDGSWIWINARGRVIEWTNDGRPLRMMGTHSDITDRKRAEQAIKESEAKYRTLVEQLPAIIYTTPPNPDPGLDYISPHVAKVLGRSVLDFELDPNTWRNNIHPDDRERVVAELTESLAKGGSFASEYRMIARDGRIVWFRDEAVLVRNEGGTPLFLQGVMFDITEQKRMEAELREREERFRMVVSSSKDAMIAIDEHGLIIIFNPAAEAMFLWTAEQAIGRPLDFLIPEPRRPTHANAMSDFFISGNTKGVIGTTAEVSARRSNGEVFPIELSLSAGRWGDKQFVLATMRDITLRKQIETELKKFKTISDHSPHGHAIIELDGHVLYTNAAFARMHGYEPEEFLCRHVSDFHTPEQMLEVNPLLDRLKQDGQFVDQEIWHKRRDGSVFPALMDAAVIADENGTPLYFSGMAVDISERKAAEAALRRQALVFDNINDGVIITDTQGWITDWNPGAERIFDYFRQEVLGKHAEMLNKPEDAKVISRSIQEGLPRDGYWSGEVAFVRKDGGEGVCEVFIVPLRDENQQSIGRIAVNRDITARKQAEEEKARLEAQLHQAQKMEAVGTLAGGVAHDFNNLLTAIFGYTDLAMNSLPKKHPAVRSLELLEQAGRQARGVINSLLTFSHKDTPVKEPVNLATSLADTIQLLRRLLPASIEIEESLPAEPEVWVSADGTQLQQVWINLAVNARDAMPRGGRLRVILQAPAQPGEAGGDGNESAAVVTLEDTGIGMSETIKSRIFEPFFTTKPRGQGTGLGLPVTQAIIANHEGRIEIESQPGHGTRVIISLPCCQPPPKAARKASPVRRPTGRGQLVLIVEDDEHVRSILVSALRSQGYQVVAAADGAEAKAHVRRHGKTLDLVILDLDLPKTSRTALLRTIRKTLPAVPILIVTGSVNPKVKEQPDQNQFLLRKPLEMSELDECIGRLMDRPPRRGETLS